MRQLISTEAKNFAFIIPGSTLIALGVVLFLAPNSIATGGSPGMAILLNALSGISIGAGMIIINIPLLLLGLRYLGKGFGIRTVITTLLCSGLVDLFNLVLKLEPISEDTLLSCLYGGVLIGIGVGLVLRGNSSSGGSTILARLFAHRFGIRPGQTILMLDMFIILSSAYVFNGIEGSLWSLISIYTTSRCINTVISGSTSERIVHIVTNQVEKISTLIQEHLGPNGTIVTGASLADQKAKTMIFIVVENRRIPLLRDLVIKNDPDAFMVTMEATDLMGRGH